MITYQEIERQLDNLAYIQLLKDVRKANMPVDKLYLPEKDLTGKLVGVRVRTILDSILGKGEYNAKKVNYHYRWYVSSKFLDRLYHDAEYEFYSYFVDHPEVKIIKKKYGFDSLYGQDFNIFERNHDNDITTLEYNKRFLHTVKRYKRFIDDLKAILPGIQQRWMAGQKEKKEENNMQERYDAIVFFKKNQKGVRDNAQNTVR